MDRQLVPIPETATLAGILASVLGRVTVTGRWFNPEGSTFSSEIVRCRLTDQRELSLFCKYGRVNSEKGLDHRAFGHRGGLTYETQVYREVLADSTAPRFYGVHADPATGLVWLILEYLDAFVPVSNSAEPGSLGRAASWLGHFHALWEGRTADVPLRFLTKYDGAYYFEWVRRTAARAASLEERLPWLENICGHADALLEALSESSSVTVIHGEYYPNNVLVRGSAICPVDWESSAIAPGEIDLASLTEGRPESIVRECEREYRRARWPEGAPQDFSERLAAARTYWSFRWLGSRLDWSTSLKQQRRLLQLQREAERRRWL